MPKVFIGTSGFSYSHWQRLFYPKDLRQKDWLRYYAKHFDTVEINATFYGQMKPQTFKKWRATVGDDFVFSIKASRFITHIKKLKDCREAMEKLMEGVRGLRSGTRTPHFRGDARPKLSSQTNDDSSLALRKTAQTSVDKKKAGDSDFSEHSEIGIARPLAGKDVVLFQFPPRWQVNSERLKDFVKLLPKDFRFAFEFRDKSWLNSKIYKILGGANCALVIQGSPHWPTSEEIVADFTYLRFHGSKSLYSSDYSERKLKIWAKKIKNWFKDGLDVYCYFNNDAMGYAVENARTLKELLPLPKVVQLFHFKGGAILTRWPSSGSVIGTEKHNS